MTFDLIDAKSGHDYSMEIQTGDITLSVVSNDNLVTLSISLWYSFIVIRQRHFGRSMQ